MSEQIYLLVEMIKERINQNLQAIGENEEIIKNFLEQAKIAEQSEQITKSYRINRNLRDENSELINIQLRLVTYLNKFKEVLGNQTQKASSLHDNIENGINPSNSIEYIDYSISFDIDNFYDDQIFALTIKGELIFESSHPKFYDEDFFKRLFKYYTDSQNYEMCSLLFILKGKSSKLSSI